VDMEIPITFLDNSQSYTYVLKIAAVSHTLIRKNLQDMWHSQHLEYFSNNCVIRLVFRDFKNVAYYSFQERILNPTNLANYYYIGYEVKKCPENQYFVENYCSSAPYKTPEYKILNSVPELLEK